MKKRITRLASLLVAIAIMVSLTACGGDTSSSGTTQTGATTTSTSETSTASETVKTEPIAFDLYVNYNWWAFDYPFDGSDPLTKWIIENKGVTMNIKKPSGNEREMQNLMIAADNLPDAILCDKDDIWRKMISLGKVVSIDDYLNKYPGYKAAVTDEARALTAVDGKNWGLLNCSYSKDWLGFAPTYPLINEKIYAQLGKPKLDTFDDLLAYCETVKNADIKVDGKPVVPLQFITGTTSGADGNQFWSGWGEERINEEYYNFTSRPITDGKLDATLRDPKFKDNILLHQKLFNLGYVNKDAFVEKPEQVKAKLETGRVAVYYGYDSGDRGRDANAALKKAGSDITYTGIAPFVAAGVDRNTFKIKGTSTTGWNVISITTKAKNPERIYEFLDWVSSDEGQLLTMFGPKGTIWNEKDSEGYPILLPGKQFAKSKELPIFDFQLPVISKLTDKAKLKVNSALPPENQDFGSTMQAQLELNKLVKDITEFDFIQPVAGTAIGQIYDDGYSYIRDQMVKMVTAKTPQETEKILQQTIDEISKKGFDQAVDYANERWTINKVKMGIK